MKDRLFTADQIEKYKGYISKLGKFIRVDSYCDFASVRGDVQKITFELSAVTFNSKTRVAKIDITQTTFYKTIERYVTRNYNKTPIYSDIKTKTKIISKSIKLTNSNLEALDKNEDELIRKCANDIVFAIQDEKLFPSWFKKEVLKFIYRKKEESLREAYEESISGYRNKILKASNYIDRCITDISISNSRMERMSSERDKLVKRLSKIQARKKSSFLCIITFGIYAFLTSKKRIQKYTLQLKNIEEGIDFEKNEIKALESDIDRQNAIRDENIDIIEVKKEKHLVELKKEREKIDALIENIEPLSDNLNLSDDFIPLKIITGMEYEKIIGCYIIRNIENGKHYVGQSKDVYKRLKQHFKGTEPHNVIFAEDYFSSKLKDRSDLFNVKIICCETKDELDRTERELIEQYDARNSGYNGTLGNS